MILKKQQGASAVEFALVLPLLVVIVFGIVEFGLILYNKAVVTNASREGARYGIVFRNTGSEVTCSDINTVINTYTSGRLVTFGTPAGVNIVYTPGSCDPGTGNPLTVNVSYQYDYLLLPSFVAGLTGSVNIAGQTTMIKE